MMSPAHDQFPAVKARLHWERSHRRQQRIATIGLAVAATLVLAVVGNHLVQPPTLDAEQQLEKAMSRSQLLEQQLRDWDPESRVLDGADRGGGDSAGRSDRRARCRAGAHRDQQGRATSAKSPSGSSGSD